MSNFLNRSLYLKTGKISLGRAAATCIIRNFNYLGPAISNNDAAFPKPEVLPGYADGKAYGFKLSRQPNFWPVDDRIFYRKNTPPEKGLWPFGTIFYAYMVWMFYANFEMLSGDPELMLPNPDLWTDEELGIPPDDEG